MQQLKIKSFAKKSNPLLGIEAQVWTPITLEARQENLRLEGRLGYIALDQPGLCSESLSLKTKKTL